MLNGHKLSSIDISVLDARVEDLEKNGGSGGNVTALEERVPTLEVTSSNHETRLVTAQADIEGIFIH